MDQASQLAINKVSSDYRFSLIAQRQLLTDYPMLQSIQLFNEYGDLYYTTGIPSALNTISNTDYFIAYQTKASNAIHVAPLVSSANDSKDWLIPVAKPLWKDGLFKGVIIANLHVSYFLDLYQHLDLGQKSVIALLNLSGHMLVRYPEMPEMIGKDFSNTETFKQIKATNSGSFESQYIHDENTYVSGFSQIPAYHVAILVGRNKQQILTPWFSSLINHVVFVCLTLVVFSITATTLNRHIKRAQLAEKRQITAEHHEALAMVSEERFRLAFVGGSIGFWDWDLPAKRIYFNEYWYHLLGRPYVNGGLDQNEWRQIVHSDDLPALDDTIQALLTSPEDNYESRHRLQRSDGEWVWVLVRGRVMTYDHQQQPLRVTGTIIDITEQQKIRAALEASEARFRTMFRKHSSVMLLINPENGKIEDANDAAVKFYGYSLAQLQEMTITQINTLPSELVEQQKHQAVDEQKNTFVFPHRLADGRVRQVEVHSSPLDVDQGKLLFSIIHDVTDREKANSRIQHMAMTDQLTKLANRNEFNQQFVQWLKICQEQNQSLTLLLLDLDKFKAVNDTFGHPAGDQVLINTAHILRESCRGSDVVARLGGDEFAILIPMLGEQEAIVPVAERILAAFTAPIVLSEEIQVHVGISIGIAQFPLHGTNQEDLVRHADQALYQAKHGFDGKVCFYRNAD